jgi:hypothetical protein
MKSWEVTVKVWGRVSTRIVDAASRGEAEEKVLRDVGFSIEVKPHATPEKAAQARADEAKVRYLIEEGVVVVNRPPRT